MCLCDHRGSCRVGSQPLPLQLDEIMQNRSAAQALRHKVLSLAVTTCSGKKSRLANSRTPST
jgi:hypothetical protein